MQRVSINPWPYAHTAATVIRDDDVSYFTPPYKIEQIYEKAWKQGFRVSLGVIPCVKAIDDPFIPPSYRGRSSLHKLPDNKDLVKFLKERMISKGIDVAQHGYTHELLNGKPEFSIGDSHQIMARLEKGRKILEECLPTKISVFIAPWNTVSKQACDSINESGLALCGEEKSFGNFFVRARTFRIMFHGIYTRCFDQSKKRVRVRPSGMIELHPSFDWWSEEQHTCVFDEEGLKKARKEFEKTIIKEDMFCLLNHHWSFFSDWQDEINPKKLDFFCKVLLFLNRYNIWKTTLSEIVTWVKKLEKIEVHVDAKKLTLRSSTTMRGVTINGKGFRLIPAGDSDVIVKEKEGNTSVVYKQLEPGENQIAFIEPIN